MVTATVALASPAVAQDEAGHVSGDRWRDCDDCPEIVAIPAGTFTMGSPTSETGRYDREGPAHQVTIIKPFAIGIYEVTDEAGGQKVGGHRGSPRVRAGGHHGVEPSAQLEQVARTHVVAKESVHGLRSA